MTALGVLLFVAGAILAWGVKLVSEDFDLFAIGVILMVAGAAAFVAGLITESGWGWGFGHRKVRSERYVSQDGRHEVSETSARQF
jgi:hypothetical protein